MMEKLSNDSTRATVRETERPVAVSAGPEIAQTKPESQQAVVPVKAPAEREQIEQTVVRMNEYLKEIRRDLHFSVDEGSGHVVVKVVNPGTEEVIRQIPSEEVLAIAERLREQAEAGLFVQERA